MKRVSTMLSAVVLTVGLAACGTPGSQQQGEVQIRRGTIEQITPVQIGTTHHQGVGAVVGGLAGLGIGSLIGAGTGRDVAMVLGTVGGALAGNEIQKKHDNPVYGQQVIVRTTSGVLVAITQPTNSALATGMRVYIEGSGDGARVIPQ